MNNQQRNKASASKPKVQKQQGKKKGPKRAPPLSNSSQPSAIVVKAPTASSTVRRTNRPQMRGLPNGDIDVSHREYILDLNGSVGFLSNLVGVNPGLPGTFPWLSQIANNYESYRFSKLKFCFETEAPTTATGTVMMAIDFDASDPAPIDKQQLMVYRNAVRSPPWADCCFESMKEDLEKRKTYYVRNGALSANQDVKLYDTGNLFLCTQGQANTNNVGELYVEYTVRLFTPQINDPSVGNALWGEFKGTSNAAPFSAQTGNLPASAGSTGTTTSVSTFTFSQPWRGVVALTVVGTTLTAVSLGGTAQSEATEGNIQNSAQTVAVCQFQILAQAGQTVIVTIANASITSAQIDFGQGAFT